jgi:hypothetical protein
MAGRADVAEGERIRIGEHVPRHDGEERAGADLVGVPEPPPWIPL